MEKRKTYIEKAEHQKPKFAKGERIWRAGLFDKGEREIASFYWNGKTFMYFFKHFKSPYPEKCISELTKTKQ